MRPGDLRKPRNIAIASFLLALIVAWGWLTYTIVSFGMLTVRVKEATSDLDIAISCPGALALLVDRGAIQEQILGRLGQVAPNWINYPERFRSKNIRWEFNIDKANQLLDAGGWKRGADGVRVKDGKRLKMLFQTATNAVARRYRSSSSRPRQRRASRWS